MKYQLFTQNASSRVQCRDGVARHVHLLDAVNIQIAGKIEQCGTCSSLLCARTSEGMASVAAAEATPILRKWRRSRAGLRGADPGLQMSILEVPFKED